MKIIDAQVHLWSQAVNPPASGHRQVASFSAEELLAEMAEAGVDAGLIHPPLSWDPASNELAIEAVQKHPGRFAIMGQFRLESAAMRSGFPAGDGSPAWWDCAG